MIDVEIVTHVEKLRSSGLPRLCWFCECCEIGEEITCDVHNCEEHNKYFGKPE